MKNLSKSLLPLACLTACLPSALAQNKTNAPSANSFHPLEPGIVSTEIKTASDAKWSYFVYTPKAYTTTRKWPVMFIMSPNGGANGAATLKRYMEGAEKNNWILALSVQSKNGFGESEKAEAAMVNDVLKKLPVDNARLYASGFSGGSREAAGLVQKDKARSFAGILACGAGNPLDTIPAKTVAFGLCGSNCFNRWDMACCFKQIKNKDSKLRFFVGNHDWANASELTYAITWLNASYLKSASPANKALAEERKTLLSAIQEEIKTNQETNPEKAYDWALCLAMAASSMGNSPSKEMQELTKNPKVQLYADGLKALDAFIKKHFATDTMDYVNNNGTPAARKESELLATKYKETGLFDLFTRMGQPSVKP